MFAGRECSRALGKMTMKETDCNDDLQDLSEKELKTLHDWEAKLQEKYTIVGQVEPVWTASPANVYSSCLILGQLDLVLQAQSNSMHCLSHTGYIC